MRQGESHSRQESGPSHVWRVPPLWLVILAWLVALCSGAFLIFVLLPPLELMAQGMLLDRRPFGFDLEEARGILYHLGETGRAEVQFPYLLVDVLLAISLSAALCLGSLRFLGSSKGFAGRFAKLVPAIAVVMPILAGLFDLWENWQLYRMMDVGLDIKETDIVALKRATSFKFGFYLFGILGFIIIFVSKLLHRKN
jgi:hypothetical protein